MLDILAVLSNEGRAKLCKFLSELWDDFGTNQIFDGCFGVGIGVNIYVKLDFVSRAI